MSIRIAIIDQRIPIQDPRFRHDLQTLVIGAQQTLRVGENDRPDRMLTWIRNQVEQTHSPSETVDLDLVSHGAGADHEGCRVFWVNLGQAGISSVNVHLWRSINGLVHKIRVYACGVNSDAYRPHIFTYRTAYPYRYSPGSMAPSPMRRCLTPAEDQHQLMRQLASHTGAQVKYSLNTMLGALQTQGRSQLFGTDRMLSPVFIAYPNGSRQQLR